MLQKWWIKKSIQVDHTKCSNGHGCHFLEFHYDSIWLINVHPPTNPPKPMSKLTSKYIDVILQFENLEKKTTKST